MEILASIKFIDYPGREQVLNRNGKPLTGEAEGEDIVRLLQKYKRVIIRGNLREENEGVNIILKQANKSVRKDKFSAFEYGLYYIKQEEESKKKKKHFKVSDFMFFTS